MSRRSLSCAEALGLADEGHDRPLPPEQEEALRGHLDACGPCRAAAAGSERVHGALLAMEAPPASGSFTDEVVARLDRGPPRKDAPAPRSLASPWLRGAAALVGTGAVASLAVLVLPLDAAADGVGALVPAAAPALPAVPPELASFLAGLQGLLPPWAAGALAALAVAAGLLQVGASRRRAGGTAS